MPVIHCSSTGLPIVARLITGSRPSVVRPTGLEVSITAGLAESNSSLK